MGRHKYDTSKVWTHEPCNSQRRRKFDNRRDMDGGGLADVVMNIVGKVGSKIVEKAGRKIGKKVVTKIIGEPAPLTQAVEQPAKKSENAGDRIMEIVKKNSISKDKRQDISDKPIELKTRTKERRTPAVQASRSQQEIDEALNRLLYD